MERKVKIKSEKNARKARAIRNQKRATVFLAVALFLIPVFLMSYFGATAFPAGAANITQSQIEAGMSYCGKYPVSLNVDGKTAETDVPPVIVNGRTLVPTRAVFEGIGAEVSWDDETKQVDITMGDAEVRLTIGSKTAIVNGSETTLEVPALIIEDRTMIPVRFVAESLGFDVDWHNSSRTVKLKAPKIEVADSDAPASPTDDVEGTDPGTVAEEEISTGTTTDEETDPGVATGDLVYLPAALTASNLTNPSQALQSFLNTCSGKTVIFPAGRTYVLEKQLVLHDVSNLTIDFNGSTFKLPNNSSIASRSDTGHYVPANTAMVIHDVNGLTIKNYTIDGNKANIPTTTWCVGMAIMNADGFDSYNGSFKNSNYHQIVIGPTNVSTYNKDINFKNTYFKDHGGATGGAGISDVYVSNHSTDDFSFVGVEVDNTALKAYSSQAQCFYIAGHNGYFEDVVTNNCAVPLDVRYGKHVAKDFTVTNAERVLMVQPYPGGNGSNGYAKLTASNFTGKNIKGGVAGGATGLYIIGCDYCNIDNFDIDMDPTSSYASYGIRVRKFYSQFPVDNVNITNTTVSNFKIAGVIMEGLNDSTNFKNIELISATSSTYGVKTQTCTAYQYLTGLVTTNCIESSSPDSMLKLL